MIPETPPGTGFVTEGKFPQAIFVENLRVMSELTEGDEARESYTHITRRGCFETRCCFFRSCMQLFGKSSLKPRPQLFLKWTAAAGERAYPPIERHLVADPASVSRLFRGRG